MTLELLISLLAIGTSACTLIGFAIARIKDHEETVRWMQQVDDKLEKHNGYAEMFANNTKDMSELKADIAYIRGQISKG